MEKSDRIPGKFLKLMYIMIEKAVKNNWTEIDKDKVDLTWKEDPSEMATEESDEEDLSALPKTRIRL